MRMGRVAAQQRFHPMVVIIARKSLGYNGLGGLRQSPGRARMPDHPPIKHMGGGRVWILPLEWLGACNIDILALAVTVNWRVSACCTAAAAA